MQRPWLQVSLESRSIRIDTPKRDPNVVSYLREGFTEVKWDKKQKCFYAPLNRKNALAATPLVQQFNGRFKGDFQDEVEKALDLVATLANQMGASTWADVGEAAKKEWGVTSWGGPEFQLIGTSLLAKMGRCFLADGVGAGKTKMALQAAHVVGAQRVLILCPAGVVPQKWASEVGRWIGDNEPVAVWGKGSSQEEALSSRWLIMSHARAANASGLMHQFNPDCLIVDESHRMKSQSSIIAKRVLKLVKKCEPQYRWLISANPMPNRPIELLTQLEALGRLGEMGGRRHFLNTYVKPRKIRTRKGDYWDYNGTHNLDQLLSEIRRIGFIKRPRSLTMPDLPPLRVETLRVQPDAKYKRLHEQGATGVTEMNALKRQAAMCKIEALVDWAKDQGEGVLVFTHHRDVAKKAEEGLKEGGVKVWRVDGKTPDKATTAAIEGFGEGGVLVATMGALSESVDITAATQIVFLEPAWRPDTHAQALGRARGRMNDPHDALVYFFITEGSIDEPMLEYVSNKEVLSGDAEGESEEKVVASALASLGSAKAPQGP